MADFVKSTPIDRLSRFDRADFGARQPQVSRPDAGKSSLAESEDSRAVSDVQLTADFLQSLGWSQEDVAGILGGPAPADSLPQAAAHLRSLGWTESEIARLLAGPDKSHLTAEALFQQHAANPAADQELLVKAMSKAGARKVNPDPALLAGLDPAHLAPDTPSDVQQIITQFAALPDVQKQRFLLLLRQNENGNPAGSERPQKPSRADPSDKGKKPSDSEGGVLPVVKGGLDVLSTALKGLLGGSKSAGTNGGGPKTSTSSPKGLGGKKGKAQSDEPDDTSEPGTDDSSDGDSETSTPSTKNQGDKKGKDPSDESDDTSDQDTEDSTDTGDVDESDTGEADSPESKQADPEVDVPDSIMDEEPEILSS